MIRRVFRCTYAPTTWHWELVKFGMVVATGKRESRLFARMAADSRRREMTT